MKINRNKRHQLAYQRHGSSGKKRRLAAAASIRISSSGMAYQKCAGSVA